ncbi:MAG: DNA polymerase III subunit gamma/tau [bacterium]
MTYYLKYRPQTLGELDNSDVRESLKQIVMSGRIPHALLFSGPKGTGKTSAARIIAKVVNCEALGTRQKAMEPCNKCDQCKSITKGTNLDVIEIDAASHRGIDDVRMLRDAVKLSPSSAKKKVYIIDEAHMLTTEASNALLKTLEEPPDHVVFILATTNPEKLIETIRSRATQIHFTKPSIEELSRSLEKVVRGEKIKIPIESLDIIAKASKGSFRDAVKILEQLISEKVGLEVKRVDAFLFKSGSSDVDAFLEMLSRKDVQKAIIEVEKLVASGVGIDAFIEAVLERLRVALLTMVGIGENALGGFTKKELIDLSGLLFQSVSDMVSSPIEQLPLEIAVVKWCSSVETKEVANKINSDIGTVKIKGKNIDDGVWKDILTKIRLVNTSIEALLRAARPMCFDGKVLTLSVYYRFHKERLEETHHRRVLEDVASEILGGPVRVVCTLTEPPPKQEITSLTPTKSGLTSAEGVLTPSDGVLTEGRDKDIMKIAEEIFGN